MPFTHTLMAVAAALVLLLGASTSAAQTGGSQPWKHQLNITGGIDFPGGTYADETDLSLGLGVEATYYRQFARRDVFLSLMAGYHRFGFGSFGSDRGLTVVPLLGGVRYNFTLTGIQPYIGAEIGIYLLNEGEGGSVTVNDLDDIAAGILPKAGLRIPIEPQLDVDLSLKYHLILTSELSFLGLNAGVAYTISSF